MANSVHFKPNSPSFSARSLHRACELKRVLTLPKGEDGFIRVIARADNHLLLGLQGVGAGLLAPGCALAQTTLEAFFVTLSSKG
jgi:hypothetical protein